MSVYESVARRLGRGELILLDGGTGTTIEEFGVEMDQAAWSALANVDHPDVVRRVHEAFIAAGADLVLANTFSAAAPTLAAAGRGDSVVEINRLGVRAARLARDAFPDRSVAVGGSISSYPASSKLAARLPGYRAPDRVELRAAYAEQVEAQLAEGIDFLALEMINSPSYGQTALEVAAGAPVPVWLGVSPVDDGQGGIGVIADGPDERLSLDELLRALLGPEVAVVGLMHCQAAVVAPALDVLAARWDGPVMVYPEVGTWRPPHWEAGDLDPAEFLGLAQTWVDRGVQVIGGCCGFAPRHIEALRGLKPPGAVNDGATSPPGG
jgi:S-methylmethionine-dependent homocysteine/selenocysteine methylase